LLPCEGSDDPVSEVLETLVWRNKQNHKSSIDIPTNATAPAAPPIIAAREIDIWYGNHFTFAVQIYTDYYYTSNLDSKTQ
jgi:hypothetical protein